MAKMSTTKNKVRHRYIGAVLMAIVSALLGQIFYFPVPIGLLNAREKLYSRLALEPGSKVLDAGCGSEAVAIFMAEEKGLNVVGIDITPRHLASARKNVQARDLQHKVSIESADYHDLTQYANESFDGIYTMETYVHADDPPECWRTSIVSFRLAVFLP
ncbi:S-adenosyl-L-methionine-dependent methyltransferase [Clohesyomyces aquaticus]|uniref:S-adenosyl-L-methionine-dependent methyltransferase n=1 Tax=Clohesyomyces aquaticus TaxID=1231657 RepID=A0A1Y1YKM7_9PLEO|nr:S-adenosyl-L-methionine-dependent methyltransferase [Clohesyomyces aquaticus]